MCSRCRRRQCARYSALPDRLVAGHRQLEVLEHGVVLEHRRLLELAADAGLRDLRLGMRQQIDASGRTRPSLHPAASCP